MACGGWVVLGWGVSGSYTALCSDLLLSVTLPCAWEGGKVMITKFCISHFDYVSARAYTEKRTCNSLCTVRTHPTSYQRPDILKIESSMRT